jgi:hypothetical protein
MTEKKIQEKMSLTGWTRMEVIAHYAEGEQAAAASRCVTKRALRRELVDAGVDFETACLVVKLENREYYD